MNLSNYKTILAKTNKCGARLVAVSKTKPVSDILKVYEEGQRIFGENRVSEIVEKAHQVPEDLEWHMIGHLQRNKVKEVVPHVSMIHSIDSVRLLKEIQKEAAKINRTVPCLLQLKIAQEESKYGFSLAEILTWLETSKHLEMENVQFVGVMGMATFTDDHNQLREEFKRLKSHFDKIKMAFFKDKPTFKEISMGMSDDFEIALEEGSTMVRIGSSIFGER